MKIKDFLKLNNLKKINKSIAQERTIIREFFHKDNHFRSKSNETTSSLLTLRKQIIESNFLFMDRPLASQNILNIYLRTLVPKKKSESIKNKYFLEFINKEGKKVKISELTTKTLMDHFTIPDNKENFINNLKENPDNDLAYRKKSLIYFKDFISSLDFLKSIEDRELIIFNKIKVIKFFKYNYKFDLELEYIKERENSIELGSKEVELNSTLFSKFTITNKNNIETIDLKSLNAEEKGAYNYSKEYKVLKEQEDIVKEFIKSYQNNKI